MHTPNSVLVDFCFWIIIDLISAHWELSMKYMWPYKKIDIHRFPIGGTVLASVTSLLPHPHAPKICEQRTTCVYCKIARATTATATNRVQIWSLRQIWSSRHINTFVTDPYQVLYYDLYHYNIQLDCDGRLDIVGRWLKLWVALSFLLKLSAQQNNLIFSPMNTALHSSFFWLTPVIYWSAWLDFGVHDWINGLTHSNYFGLALQRTPKRVHQ